MVIPPRKIFLQSKEHSINEKLLIVPYSAGQSKKNHTDQRDAVESIINVLYNLGIFIDIYAGSVCKPAIILMTGSFSYHP